MFLRRASKSPVFDDATSDVELVRAYSKHGHRRAFDILFARHKNTVYSVLWSLCSNRAITEDVSQYAWLKLIEHIGEAKFIPTDEHSVRAFLLRVGRNRYIDEYQRKHAETRTQSLVEGDEPVGSAEQTVESAASAQSGEQIETALAGLPVEQRDVVALWLQGFSIKEMMAATGAPRDTVLSRKKYALSKLRRALGALRSETTDADA